jgi:hypothetical protein
MADDVKRRLQHILGLTINDPVKFVEIFFKVKPTPQQQTFMMSFAENKRTAVKSGHGVGKSAGTAWLIIWYLLTRPQARIPVTAPTMHQLMDILWAEIGTWILKSPLLRGLCDFTSTKLSIKGKYSKTWFAVPISARKPESLQGFHREYLAFFADEASGIPAANFEAMEGAMTGENSRMLLTGNPTQLDGYFYDAFNKSKHMFSTMTLSCTESEIVDKQWIETMKEKYGVESNWYRAHVLGEFPVSNAGNEVIPLPWIEKSFMNENPNRNGKNIFGVDVARFGDDETVIVHRKGFHVENIFRYKTMDEVQVANEISRLFYVLNPEEIRIEAAGVGGGVFDIIKHKRLKTKLVSFIPQSYARDAKFYNLMTEAWWNVRELLHPSGTGFAPMTIPQSEDVAAQLSSRRYLFKNGKIALEEKNKHKRDNNVSPDIGDAVAIAFYDGTLSNGIPLTVSRRSVIGSESEWEKMM